MTRSTNVSMEKLNGSNSSLHSDDDDWSGVYTTPFTSFSWVYIDELEEYYVWKKPSDLPGMHSKMFFFSLNDAIYILIIFFRY